ncbi:hypothetical protein HAV15_004464 [Penicillium sp. str. |nr:hypothetical protein HAV15_004464 [Penicillium sp. str. \
MPTIFPTWPHILFGIPEPISLSTLPPNHALTLNGALRQCLSLYDLQGFIAGQTPTIAAPATLHPSSIALAY